MSGISKDLVYGFKGVESISRISEEIVKEPKKDKKIKKKTRVHLKGFALGHAAIMRQSSMENTEEREEE